MNRDEIYGLIFLAVLVVSGIIVIAKAIMKPNKSLVEPLRRFFKSDPRQLTTINRTFSVVEYPNIHLALEAFGKTHGKLDQIMGYHGGSGLPGIAYEAPFYGSVTGPIQYKSVDIDLDQQMQCPRNGIYMIDSDQGKIAAQCNFWGEQASMVELHLMAQTAEKAKSAMEIIRKLVSDSSVYRGKIISLEGQQQTSEDGGWVNVKFHRLPKVKQEDIILPEETMQLIERNVVSFYKHADTLRKAGRSVKRGILFYGNPGTGKTYTAKYLAGSLENVTVMLLSGEQLWLLKESFQMARLLAPALVIMEDVDLIAHTRDETLGQTVLHQLLNEMDGLSNNSDVIFLLTTNRPEVLEPALALRPGRVDQAIKFPMPDAVCRRRLIQFYCNGLEVELKELDRFVDKTDGASPSFIQELIRKSSLVAAEEQVFDDGNGKLKLLDSHVQQALDELLLSSPLTRNLLGFRAKV
jgi:transitional endoplasmic reticulum ATPase